MRLSPVLAGSIWFYLMMLDSHTKLAYILESPAHYGSWKEFRHDVEAVARCGYEGVELQAQTPGDLDNPEFALLLEDCDLRLVVIQTGSAYLKHGICLASPDPAVRGAATDLLRRYIDCTSGFGALVVFGLLQGAARTNPTGSVLLNVFAGISRIWPGTLRRLE
jgi:sugar phosphate isomerase/epimerase